MSRLRSSVRPSPSPALTKLASRSCSRASPNEDATKPAKRSSTAPRSLVFDRQETPARVTLKSGWRSPEEPVRPGPSVAPAPANVGRRVRPHRRLRRPRGIGASQARVYRVVPNCTAIQTVSVRGKSRLAKGAVGPMTAKPAFVPAARGSARLISRSANPVTPMIGADVSPPSRPQIHFWAVGVTQRHPSVKRGSPTRARQLTTHFLQLEREPAPGALAARRDRLVPRSPCS